VQTTKRRILAALREQEHSTADKLARELGLTPMAVRHHLGALAAEGLVAAASVQRLRHPGRPRKLFGLTPAGEAVFPDGTARLCALLLQELRQDRHAELAERLAKRLTPPGAPGSPELPLESRLAGPYGPSSGGGGDAEPVSSSGGGAACTRSQLSATSCHSPGEAGSSP
jgi:DNA-binding transcriptional ArsR family regulator